LKDKKGITRRELRKEIFAKPMATVFPGDVYKMGHKNGVALLSFQKAALRS